MKHSDIEFSTNRKRSRPSIAVTMAGLLLVSSVDVQAQTPSAGSLSNTQALVLLQALAKANGASTPTMSAAQMQLLSHYIQQVSQSTTTAGINLGQAQTSLAQGHAVGSAAALPLDLVSRVTTTEGANGVLSPEKKADTIRIGVVLPQAQMGQGNSGVNVAEPLRAVLIQYLSGPALEIVPVAAMLASQVEAETKQKACDYVLYSSITQKMNSGGLGMMHKAMPLMSMIPMVGMMGSMAGAVAGSAAGAAMSGASGLSGVVKAKTELTFEYRLTASGSSVPVLTQSAKAQAKQDGEDIVTPLIAHAAEAILAQVSSKK